MDPFQTEFHTFCNFGGARKRDREITDVIECIEFVEFLLSDPYESRKIREPEILYVFGRRKL